jgi:hypothetical protein
LAGQRKEIIEFLRRNFRKGGANLRVCHDVPAGTSPPFWLGEVCGWGGVAVTEDARLASAVAQKLWRDRRRAARESEGFYSAWTRGSPPGVGQPRAQRCDTFSIGLASLLFGKIVVLGLTHVFRVDRNPPALPEDSRSLTFSGVFCAGNLGDGGNWWERRRRGIFRMRLRRMSRLTALGWRAFYLYNDAAPTALRLGNSAGPRGFEPFHLLQASGFAGGY